MTRTCSCGALSMEGGEFDVASPPCGASVPEEVVVGDLNSENCTFEIGGSVESGDGGGEVGVAADMERGVKEAKLDDGVDIPQDGVAAEGVNETGGDTEAPSGLISRTLGSISSFGSSISPPSFTNLVDFSSGLFTRNQDERGKVKDVQDYENAPQSQGGSTSAPGGTPAGGETPASPHPSSESAPSGCAPPDVVPSPSATSPIVENVVKLDDKPDLFRSLNGMY